MRIVAQCVGFHIDYLIEYFFRWEDLLDTQKISLHWFSWILDTTALKLQLAQTKLF